MTGLKVGVATIFNYESTEMSSLIIRRGNIVIYFILYAMEELTQEVWLFSRVVENGVLRGRLGLKHGESW